MFVVLLGFAGLGGLAATAVFRWPDLQRAWHLDRMRKDPSVLDEALSSSDPPLLAACREYVKEPAGRASLARELLEEIDACEWIVAKKGAGPASRILAPLALASGPTDHMAFALREDGQGHRYTCMSWRGKAGHSTYTTHARPGDSRRRNLILELLPACAGESFRIPTVSGLEIHVASGGAIRAATAEAGGDDTAYLRQIGWMALWGLGGLPSDVEHVCLVRRLR